MSTQDDMVIVPLGSGGMGGGSLPMPSRSDRADLIDKIKPEQMVEVIRHRLLGQEFIGNEWRDVPALKDRKLTEVGAWEIANIMLGVSTINISISKFKDVEVKRRALSIAKTVQYNLLENWREYGLRNKAQQYYVHEIVFSNTLAVLKQADEASIQELLKSVVNENRNVNTTTQKEGMGARIKRALGVG